MIKNINDFYFTNDEYDIFSKENASLGTKEIQERRNRLQEKLLQLNSELYPLILQNNLNLSTHKSSEHITSLAYPCFFNRYRVDWLGIRYGRNARDIQDLEEVINNIPNYQRTREDKRLGFQKYACLQVNICYTGVEIGIFHSVPDFAVDRMYMHEHLDNKELQNKIIEEIRKLKGYGYVWEISNEDVVYPFDFDKEDPKDFIKFYKDNDKDGCWSMMLKHFPRYDERINKQNIVNTALEIITDLKPLYELVIWKRKEH